MLFPRLIKCDSLSPHDNRYFAGERLLNMPAKTTSKTSKRTLIEPRKGSKRYVRRTRTGQFSKETGVGRSLAADRRSKAKAKVAKGQGDRGDVKR
jgi:hypothetical protein